MPKSVAEHLARCLEEPEFNAEYHALDAEFAAERQRIALHLAAVHSAGIHPQAVTKQSQLSRPRTYGDSSRGMFALAYAA